MHTMSILTAPEKLKKHVVKRTVQLVANNIRHFSLLVGKDIVFFIDFLKN